VNNLKNEDMKSEINLSLENGMNLKMEDNGKQIEEKNYENNI
jgi:hypothetical protein